MQHLSNAEISSLASIIVVALVARRELRTSTRVAGRLWIRPAIMIAVTLLFAGLAIVEAPGRAIALAPWLAGGIALGAVTGNVLLRFTSVRAADRPDAVVVRGSLATVGVWLVVLLVRLGARWLFGAGDTVGTLDASVGTIAVVAVASAVLAAAFHRAIAARTGATI
jgi:hypothetical protein